MLLHEARMDILKFLGQKTSSWKAEGLVKGGLLSFRPRHLPSIGCLHDGIILQVLLSGCGPMHHFTQ